jgi:hypothetical protein
MQADHLLTHLERHVALKSIHPEDQVLEREHSCDARARFVDLVLRNVGSYSFFDNRVPNRDEVVDGRKELDPVGGVAGLEHDVELGQRERSAGAGVEICERLLVPGLVPVRTVGHEMREPPVSASVHEEFSDDQAGGVTLFAYDLEFYLAFVALQLSKFLFLYGEFDLFRLRLDGFDVLFA